MFKAIKTLLNSIFSRSSAALNSEGNIESKLRIATAALESNRADAQNLIPVLEEEKKKAEAQVNKLKTDIAFLETEVSELKVKNRIFKKDLENLQTEYNKSRESYISDLNRIKSIAEEDLKRKDSETRRELEDKSTEIYKISKSLETSRKFNTEIITSLENITTATEVAIEISPEEKPIFEEIKETIKVNKKLTREDIKRNLELAKEESNLNKKFNNLNKTKSESKKVIIQS
jgi:chromosome segregation ATPase